MGHCWSWSGPYGLARCKYLQRHVEYPYPPRRQVCTDVQAIIIASYISDFKLQLQHQSFLVIEILNRALSNVSHKICKNFQCPPQSPNMKSPFQYIFTKVLERAISLFIFECSWILKKMRLCRQALRACEGLSTQGLSTPAQMILRGR